MMQMNGLMAAERQREARALAAARCCGIPARPRVSRREMRLPRLLRSRVNAACWA